MRIIALSIPLLIAACSDSQNQSRQPGMTANIADSTPSDRGHPTATDNVAAPAAPAPPPEAPTPPAATLIPPSIQGQWAGLDERCGDRAASQELTITDDSLIFHESVGQVEAVSMAADGQMTIRAAFTGEGQSWKRTLSLSPSIDGRMLTIAHDGTAVLRKRC